MTVKLLKNNMLYIASLLVDKIYFMLLLNQKYSK